MTTGPLRGRAYLRMRLQMMYLGAIVDPDDAPRICAIGGRRLNVRKRDVLELIDQIIAVERNGARDPLEFVKLRARARDFDITPWYGKELG